ncbi:hypothetical protein [Mycoplasma bradburyae]|uniref:hypothetical protein n=1 Tax=Mycoplasma bradburyae TaxID=2963128 RepID=UPI002341E586|nr:hypothetical protein [Mycoplasma bradburyae]MDC4182467.1 hypothetical protein [Mycoplasma bradburyae]
MKQKTKKLLQLSFSLGFLATTALVATSCKQPMTVAPKPTDPSKPTNPKNPSTGNPEEPSTPTEPVKPTEPAKPVDTTEAKNKLKEVISKKDEKLAMYADYSVIKGELEKAYSTAELVSKKDNATEEELTDAKNKLEEAIKKANSDKNKFDADNNELINEYSSLKELLNNSDIKAIESEAKYSFVKQELTPKLESAKLLISEGYQKNGLNKEELLNKKEELTNELTNFNSLYKQNIEQYYNGKSFVIDSEKIQTNKDYTDNHNDNEKTNNIYSGNVNLDWKYSERRVKKTDGNWMNLNGSKWIYNLNGNSAKYEFEFTNYAKESLKLIFPYKIMRNQYKNDYALDIFLNGVKITTQLAYRGVQYISLAEIELNNLKFGKNKLTFSVPVGKKNPLIGNMYLLSDDSKIKDVIYQLNGQTDNENGIISVDLSKAIGGSTSFLTKFETINYHEKEHIILKNIGKFNVSSSQYTAQYTVCIYVSEQGEYNVGLTYNSNAWSELYLSTFNSNENDTLTRASGLIKIKNESGFNNILTTEQDKIKKINPEISQLNTLKINLKQGWNNIVIGKNDRVSPYIESILFKKVTT